MKKIKIEQFPDGNFHIKLPTGIRKEGNFCIGVFYDEDGWICSEIDFSINFEKFSMPVKFKVYNRSVPECKRTAKVRALREIEKLSTYFNQKRNYYE